MVPSLLPGADWEHGGGVGWGERGVGGGAVRISGIKGPGCCPQVPGEI